MSNFISDTNRKWWILAAMTIGLAMSFIDQTAISVTLPSLQRTFHTTATALQWVIDIYLLFIAVLVIIGGRLGDLFGHRRMYLIGSVIFFVASILCGAAPNVIWLIASRALQGVGAAISIPSSSVLTLNAFGPHERGKAMGMSVGYASLCLALGPFLGGLFTQLVSWRFVFWINVPLSMIVMLIIYYAIPASPVNPGSKKLDWGGLITLIIATSTLVLALMEGVHFGWRSNFIIGLLIVALVASILFYVNEKRVEQPLINFNIFQNKTFSGAALIFFGIQIALMTTVFTAIFNQEILGFKPAMAGLLALPGTLPVMFMGPIAGSMLDKYGVRRPVVIGLTLTALGMLLNGYMAYYQNYFYLLPGMLCNGFGIPLIMSPLGTAAISAIERPQQGVASGMLNATRQFGSCIGLALLSAVILSYHQAGLKQFLIQHQQQYPQLTLQQLSNLLIHPVHSQWMDLIPIVKTSFTSAYSIGLHIGAVAAIIALVAAWCLLDNKTIIKKTNE